MRKPSFKEAMALAALALLFSWLVTRDALGHEMPACPAITPGSTVDLRGEKTITLQICDDATMYRLGQNFILVCSGGQPPPGAIELREYYKRGERG